MSDLTAPNSPSQPSCPLLLREIRVFLSSTFKDMETERNHLVKNVFPKVRAACHARQVGFSEIDLRWGITEEESKNGATVEICLAEIDRCRDFPPFFIGFLGERYGWIPKENELAAYWEQHGDSPYATPIRHAVKRGISVTELEMELGVLSEGAAEKLQGHVLFLLRDIKLTDRLYRDDAGKSADQDNPAYDDPTRDKLAKLKERIRQTPFIGADGYQTIEHFGQVIEDYLLAQLNRHFPEEATPTLLERIQAAHVAFRFHRLQNFLPRSNLRKALLKAMSRRIDRPILGPILLAGPSGHGKSALMADLGRYLKSDLGSIRWRVIDHYVGADGQNSLDGWMERILSIIHPEIEDLTGPIPESPKDRSEALSIWLSLAARRSEQNTTQEDDSRPVRFALVLDALDQLIDEGRDLGLLTPTTLGPDGILVVSAADSTLARESANAFETVEVPPFTAALKSKLIQETLRRYRKKLTSTLAGKLAQAPQAGSPLYLGLALEELRVDARHENLDELIKEILESPDVAHLFLHRFLLDEDYGRPELPTLPAAFMALLGASSNGLTENELADLLALPTDRKAADTKNPRLPQVHLSRLLTCFQPFLLNKQGKRVPMHRIFGKAALDYYGTTPARNHLYTYFQNGYGKGWEDIKNNQAAEALYQIEQLATINHDNQSGARKQLVKDLGRLWVPVTLHDTAESITLGALAALSDKETVALARRWNTAIEKLDSERLEASYESICRCALWMSDHAFDHFRSPRRLLESLLHRQELSLLPNDIYLAVTLESLGSVCHDMGDYAQAFIFYERVLAIREKAFGSHHPAVAEALRSLAGHVITTAGFSAVIFGFSGGDIQKFSDGLPLIKRALEINEKCFGADSIEVAHDLMIMARNYAEELELDSAKTYIERALAIRERIDGSNHLSVAHCLNDLGLLHCYSGEPSSIAIGRKVLERALSIEEQHHGKVHAVLIPVLNNLGIVYGESTSTMDLCRTVGNRALAIAETLLPEAHPTTTAVRNNLAFRLTRSNSQAEVATACRLYQRSFEVCEATFGSDSDAAGRARYNLSLALRRMGAYDEAVKLLSRNLYYSKTDEPTLHLLAAVLEARGDIKAARAIRRKHKLD